MIEREDEKMEDLRNYENRRRKNYGRLRELFENVQTMRLMGGYSVEEMAEALTERHPDEVFFANQYLEAHKSEDLQEIIRSAYELLYSEQPPLLPKRMKHKPEVPEVDGKTMMERCTERLIKAFIRDRVELVVSLLASDKFNIREFAGWGYDRHYIEVLTRTIKLFSPTIEISSDMLKDNKRMQAIIDRIYEELYVLTKRTKIWTCDWFDFGNLKIYEVKEEEQ